jgi:hypothetical protein
MSDLSQLTEQQAFDFDQISQQHPAEFSALTTIVMTTPAEQVIQYGIFFPKRIRDDLSRRNRR